LGLSTVYLVLPAPWARRSTIEVQLVQRLPDAVF